MSHLPRLEDAANTAMVRSERSAGAPGWVFVMLVEIANYAMLRRHVGLHDAADLTNRIVAQLKVASGNTVVRAVGRNLIEMSVSGRSRAALDAIVADCAALFLMPLTIDRTSHMIETNIGAVATLAGQCDEIRLVEEAELALAESRAERKIVVRDVAQAASAIDYIALASELSGAVDRGELFLAYQPKLHIRQQAIGSVEALVRWQHPLRGLILPGNFIPLAEQSRDIVTLTIWTIQRVIEDQKRLAAAGYDIPIFINIAGLLLTDAEFVNAACDLMRESGAKIGFEITETSVIRDPQSAIAHLNVFAGMGIIIAIDDYGAGLSSLAYLKQLPARELKIDKLFITHLTSSNRDPLIVRSTIDLAHALEMDVVAEGVEDSAALALLSVMGCDIVQGFLISRPLVFSVLIDFLSKQGERLPSPVAPFLSFAAQSGRIRG